MDVDKKAIGKRIKEVRLARGETAEEFGKKFDPIANRGLVSGWENGRYLPNTERLSRIADLGGTTVEELLHGDPIEKFVNILLEPTKSYNSEEKMLYAVKTLKEFSSMNEELEKTISETTNEEDRKKIIANSKKQKSIVASFFNTLLTKEERELFERLFIKKD